MSVIRVTQRARDILEAGFPGLRGFAEPRFRAAETDYKRAASEKAQTWFSRSALETLIRDEPEALTKRVSDLAGKTNLLYLSVPKQGDLELLYANGLNVRELAKQLLELLHGLGDSPARLQRFSDWVDERGLPNKWTFPTYLLFLVHPNSEFFVKPLATSAFLKLAQTGVTLGKSPSGNVYSHLLDLAAELRDGISDFGADMIDTQSVVWMLSSWGKDMQLSDELRTELTALIEEFHTHYGSTEEGEKHLAAYRQNREEAIANLRSLQEAETQGQDITNTTLLKLLPHADTEKNRGRGAWISVAPAVQGDLRQWFENKGWVTAGDWPKIAQTILKLVSQLKENPDTLEDAVGRFDRSRYSKGFQSGMLSPILSALRPDHFILLNLKSRRVINHFLDLNYDHVLRDYPPLCRAGRYLIHQFRDELTIALPEGTLPADGFDAFCHWLVAIRKYSFGKTRAWRVQLPESIAWNEWSTQGLIGYEDQGIGEASARSAAEWKSLPTGADPRVLDAIRYVASKLAEGDKIAVFEGGSTVRGIGEVSGVYGYREDQRLAHVLPVDWRDRTPRKSTGRRHSKLIKEMESADLVALLDLPQVSEPQASDSAFSARTFKLMASLTANPTKAFYHENREDFAAYLEEPFKRLLQSVPAELTPPMLEVLETERHIFSKILKNDFGRGGAWDHYWGAFYPKGQKRIAGAQLFVGINRNRFEWGFYAGEYAGQVSEAILGQFRRRRDALTTILKAHIAEGRFLFGSQVDPDGELVGGTRSIDEWIGNLSDASLSARMSLTRDEALGLSETELRDRIAGDFRELFPLLLIATHDDPVSAIESLAGFDEEPEPQPEYTLEECAADTGFDLATLSMWRDAIERKRQAVLYGPPGTGKTYMAEALAKVLIGGGDGFWEVVQFHPAYAYEDFMQGIRPRTSREGGLEFVMVPGRFLDFCRKAQGRSDTCVLIVDEINRANLSRVFGELMYLLEYRDAAVPLAGGGMFRVPVNVRIIGTMNTADRSIALVDHAFRRRFSFLELRPRDEVLRRFHEGTGQSVDALIEKLAELNKAIADENYHVGITFFMDPDLDTHLEAIWRMEIEPYLEEYFFDDSTTVDRFRWEKVAVDLIGSE